MDSSTHPEVAELNVAAAPAATAANVIDLPILRRGQKGEAVRLLQQLLIAYQFLGSESFNADFGVRTETAVRDFQAYRGLISNGIVNRETWRALGDEAIKRVPRS